MGVINVKMYIQLEQIKITENLIFDIIAKLSPSPHSTGQS